MGSDRTAANRNASSGKQIANGSLPPTPPARTHPAAPPAPLAPWQGNGQASHAGQPLPPTDSDWLAIQRALKLSPQQLQIVRMIQEEDLGTPAIVLRLRAQGDNPNKRSVETQIERIKAHMNEAAGHAADDPNRPIRSRASIVNRVWVEWVRLRQESSDLKVGIEA